MARDYYDILGISRGASDKEIRQAYRRSARQNHPDVNRGDDGAEARFKAVNEAYQVLSDPGKRLRYDRFGNDRNRSGSSQSTTDAQDVPWFFGTEGPGAGRRGRANSANRGDPYGGLLRDLLGGTRGPRGQDDKIGRLSRQRIPITISLEEAYSGTKRKVQISHDSMPSTPGRRLEVSIPRGVTQGSSVHVNPSKGIPRMGTDLYLMVTISPDPRFQRKGDDLLITAKVPVTMAVLGGEVDIPTIRGTNLSLKLPPETQDGRTFRLRGEGMPRMRVPERYGDLLVSIHTLLPENLNDEERALYGRLRELGH